MSEVKRYDLSKGECFIEAFTYFTHLKETKAIVEIKEVKRTRSNSQNRALHLFFTWASNELNNHGIEFKYTGLKGMDFEIPWTPDLFKTFVFKPIMKVLFEIDSTTELKTNEIDPIILVINRHFGNIGIEISFPNSFDYWIKQNY